VFVAVSEPNVAVAARAAGITRSAMGMRLLKDHLAGALVTIGNAPTALLELLDHRRRFPCAGGDHRYAGRPGGRGREQSRAGKADER
jgi:hypothetical protein